MAEKKMTIKVSEISVASVAKANSRGSRAKRTIDRSGETCWAQTVLIVNGVLPLAEIDATQDEKVIKEQVRDAFKKAFMQAVEDDEHEIPEKGTNARNGDTIDVIDPKTGEPKWQSWDETRNSISACGEIGQLVKAGVGDQLVVGEKEVLAKNAAKAAKPKEGPMATIKRSAQMIEQKFNELSPADQSKALKLLEELYTATATIVATNEHGEPATGTDG